MKHILTVVIALSAVLAGYGQARIVTGKVTDAADKSGLPGVNVNIGGTSKGTQTDIEGAYSLEVAENDVELIFSYVGYKSATITIGTQTAINVSLEADTQTLQEVIVVGYGVQKKSDITGATASVKGEDLYKQPVLTATQAVQGKVAGVQIISSGQPGSSPQIRIRGVSSAFAGTAALYVVDGVLTDDISNVNTADIVDMSILKDASAAAIYGSRGANGVVIITTRKGSGNMKVTYSNNIGFRQAANTVKMADAAEYSNYYQAATGKSPDVPVDPLGRKYNTDWFKTILRNALEQTHNISISGSSDRNNYLINAGYLNDNGIVVNNNFKRFTLRLNEEYKVASWARVGLQSSFGSSVNQNGFADVNIDPYGVGGGVYNDAYRAAPIIASKVNGLYGNTSAYQNVGNPLLDVSDNSIRVRENRLQATMFAEVKPVKWLTLKSSFGGDIRNSLNRGYFYKFLATTDTYINAGGNQLSPRSALFITNSNSFRWVWDNTATINQKFGNHEFTLLVGTTAEHYQTTSISANRNDISADKNLWYIGVGDASTSQNDGSGDAWARNSYLARLNYSYAGKYLLTATARRDGSSRLPLHNRWQNYPSVGAAWILSNEDFMANQNIFDLLKIRASFGRVGNDQIPTNSYTKTVVLNQPYAFGGSTVKPTVGNQINQIVDPNIVWENTEGYDLALEFSALNNRLSGEVDYYYKKVGNLLINIPILGDVGDADGYIITNAASVQNKGLELSLNWKDKINDHWSYSIGGNVTFNQNKVLKLNGGQAIPDGGVGSQGFTTLTDNGHAVGSFYVLKKIGVFNSDAEVASYVGKDGITPIQKGAHAGDFKYQDVNGDGVIDLQDRVFAGSYQPVAYYGINLGTTYKRFDIAVTLYGNAGNKVYNGKKGFRQLGTDNIEKNMVYNRWTSSNHTQDEPAANVGSLPASTYFVESGSFIRINNVTIGYNLMQDSFKKLGISSVRIYVTSQNLFTYKKYSGFTAELPGAPTNSGIELSAYPTTRTIAGGVNIGF